MAKLYFNDLSRSDTPGWLNTYGVYDFAGEVIGVMTYDTIKGLKGYDIAYLYQPAGETYDILHST